MAAPSVASESVPCPVCGGSDLAPWFSGPGFTMGRCRGCGLLRQNPRHTRETLLRERYDTDLPTLEEGPMLFRPDDYQGLANWESKPRAAFEASVDAVEAVRDAATPRGTWIDVGCSTGGLLVAARDRGFAVAGVDLSRDAVRTVREVHGLDARAGTLAEAGFPDGSAQVISYRQVLEHVHDLDGELALARRLLAPGGLLLVEVPHGGGAKVRYDRTLVRLRLLPPERVLRNVPEHLYYFAARHLTRLLERHGFATLSSRTYGRHRPVRSRWRRLVDAVRDRLRIGNKLRVVARRAT